jgi:hypothetical protein
MNRAIRQGETSKDKKDKTRRQAKMREFTKKQNKMMRQMEQ